MSNITEHLKAIIKNCKYASSPWFPYSEEEGGGLDFDATGDGSISSIPVDNASISNLLAGLLNNLDVIIDRFEFYDLLFEKSCDENNHHKYTFYGKHAHERFFFRCDTCTRLIFSPTPQEIDEKVKIWKRQIDEFMRQAQDGKNTTPGEVPF